MKKQPASHHLAEAKVVRCFGKQSGNADLYSGFSRGNPDVVRHPI
ncbi:hypothetical protein ACFPYJ_20500 [Paenibacillus solisilvae]|uniref:Uncharacterized protein n=1 Tax=Paenibacillus solisilvae TaxID=2486751 RepID=A0ABW0W355_9BACL